MQKSMHMPIHTDVWGSESQLHIKLNNIPHNFHYLQRQYPVPVRLHNEAHEAFPESDFPCGIVNKVDGRNLSY